ncbi:GTPase [Encephalitozoon hellem]|uniref:Developmentally-regulated GTP-binding protein n=1 Tax=Encephalitozoon hellem TaxID=27973 RepID=A0A9Q9F834_ENCHE|nr:putative GTPase [Encephalitozoon hellem ATCC 50504]AFM98257.1 putative GTPase [Encephalitozoon hellem ATCC 50504]KAG5859653.1 GTPase [Encephalitozoon hellem]UTX43134.1 ribosome-interacting GTPase 1 [Encephalitozoon hellem]WEL38591.1 developmentally-regulated GTP-binding protein [Encephalitozoon hellem]|eukprot:XP_003887238.1 putative GTPase [Encephalitozoon hellem ATCC 50504]
MNVMEKIKEIENEMARTQKNKATSNHLGILKAKLAKLRRELMSAPKSGSSGEGGFDVAKTGIARVGFVGFPSVGKSTLMSKLTGTFSAVAAYEFTTLTTVPGVLSYNGAKIQILDLPGIIEGAKDGKGRGKQVLAVARTCSLIIVCLDVLKPVSHKAVIERELEGVGIRLNKQPPKIKVTKKDKGGVTLIGDSLDLSTVKAVLGEFRISNAEVITSGPCTIDDLIDVIEGNRKYVPCIYVLNKIDSISVEELDLLYKIPHSVPVCAHLGWNFDSLLSKMWDYLDLVRIYPKPKGKPIDYEEPVILRSSRRSVSDFCNAIHRGILAKFKHALVWGTSVKHNPQKVGKEHILNDSDVVQIVKSV